MQLPLVRLFESEHFLRPLRTESVRHKYLLK
jgi:hypothetical protein